MDYNCVVIIVIIINIIIESYLETVFIMLQLSVYNIADKHTWE